jgi:hypothetical protein
MAGFFLDVAATVICPHGGTVQFSTGSLHVHVDGVPLVLAGEHHAVTGCPGAPGAAGGPCTRVVWGVPRGRALRVKIDGQPAMLVEPSAGMCVDPNGAPQGPAIISSSQVKVRGI